MSDKTEFKCSFCDKTVCMDEEEKPLPKFCPMPVADDIFQETRRLYKEDDRVHALALEAARTEAEGYGKWTRIEETIQFANKLGVKSIGIAHCAGLAKEAKIVHQILKTRGFVVNSVCCKAGRTEKEELGLSDEEKVRPGQYETACNPIGQARLLEKAGSELNIVVGLCVGHDSLFFMHSKVPVTVLITKDRVLGHNPVAALYTSHSYYKSLKE